ncbi:MAG: helix-turn-helix domain-containing protein [Acidimicrobiales bacterium]
MTTRPAGGCLHPVGDGRIASDRRSRRRRCQRAGQHPNTLDYRLRRVSELTGLSLASASGLQLLGAALLLRRLRN